MKKPLSEDQKNRILEIAIVEFSNLGYEKANINTIAEKSEVSVGVIYKYFTDKESLFTACVSHSLSFLDEIFGYASDIQSLEEMLNLLIERVQIEVRKHPEYFKLYLQVTAMSEPQISKEMVSLIESTSVRLYQSVITKAKDAGLIRTDMDTGLFAYFFDNMMMMLHFAYCCDYHKERFKIFCGKDILEKDEFVRQEMMKFLVGAFGLKQEAAE